MTLLWSFWLVVVQVHTTDYAGDPTRRLEATLVHAGPSVTVTSISNAGCFLIASWVRWSRVSVVHGYVVLLHVFTLLVTSRHCADSETA